MAEQQSEELQVMRSELQQIGTAKEKAKWLRDKKLIAKLRHDNIDVEVLLGRKEDLPPLKWRAKLLHMLHKPVGQLLLALLMLIDSAIIVGEIVVEVKRFIAEVHERDLIIKRIAVWLITFVTPVSDTWNLSNNKSFAVSQANNFTEFITHIANKLNHTSICYVNSPEMKDELESRMKVEEHLIEEIEKLESDMEKYELTVEILAITSIVVLGLFVLEVILKFIALGPKRFLCSKLEVFDALIIFASFTVDLVTFLNEDPSPEATVMIILLIWRIVRLVNGFLMHEKQTSESHNHIMQKVHKLMVFEVRYLKVVNQHHSDKLARYQDLCRNHGISEDELQAIEMANHLSLAEAIKEAAETEEPEHKRFPRNISALFGQRK